MSSHYVRLVHLAAADASLGDGERAAWHLLSTTLQSAGSTVQFPPVERILAVFEKWLDHQIDLLTLDPKSISKVNKNAFALQLYKGGAVSHLPANKSILELDSAADGDRDDVHKFDRHRLLLFFLGLLLSTTTTKLPAPISTFLATLPPADVSAGFYSLGSFVACMLATLCGHGQAGEVLDLSRLQTFAFASCSGSALVDGSLVERFFESLTVPERRTQAIAATQNVCPFPSSLSRASSCSLTDEKFFFCAFRLSCWEMPLVLCWLVFNFPFTSPTL